MFILDDLLFLLSFVGFNQPPLSLSLSLVWSFTFYLVSWFCWFRLILTHPNFMTTFCARCDLRGGVSLFVVTSGIRSTVSLILRGSISVAVFILGYLPAFAVGLFVYSAVSSESSSLDSSIRRFFSFSGGLFVVFTDCFACARLLLWTVDLSAPTGKPSAALSVPVRVVLNDSPATSAFFCSDSCLNATPLLRIIILFSILQYVALIFWFFGSVFYAWLGLCSLLSHGVLRMEISLFYCKGQIWRRWDRQF